MTSPNNLMADIGPGDSFDVMERLARPLPVVVIAELLGVPVADQEKFASWSLPLGRMIDPDSNMGEADYMAAMQAGMEFVGYFNELIEERRSTPREDVLSALIAAEEEGDRLTHDELLINLILLLIAGHETTSNLIGNGTLALCEDPQARDQLAADPAGLIRTAIDEFLRYDAPVQYTARTALADVELRGVTVREGPPGAAAARGCQPRSGRVRQARPARARPIAQPTPGLQQRHSLLSRRHARPHGRSGGVSVVAGKVAETRPRERRARLPPQHDAARAGRASGRRLAQRGEHFGHERSHRRAGVGGIAAE